MISQEKITCINLYEEGLGLYRNKKFSEAKQKFTDALEADPTDKPSKLFIERCEYYMKNPVPEDWDGVWEMKTK